MAALARASIKVTYTLRRSDLYWMYLTSWSTPIIVWLGLFFLSTPVSHSPTVPVALDVAVGLAVVFIVVPAFPLVLMQTAGTAGLIDRTIHLTINDEGVDGWPMTAMYLGTGIDRSWQQLHRPRIESRVIVLPFYQITKARRGWVVIPKRALTADQSAELVTLLRAHGFLRRGSGRSVLGRVIGIVLDRLPPERPETRREETPQRPVPNQDPLDPDKGSAIHWEPRRHD